MLIRYCFCVLVFCGYHAFSHAETKRYVVEARVVHNHYIEKLLKLLLESSKAPDEVIELKYKKLFDLQASPSRRLSEFAKLEGNVVMWTVTSKEREEFLRPIRVPIFKGLFGYRCLVIRREDQEKFAAIKTQKELATLVAGQAEQWPDTEVLRTNGFAVATGGHSENLYKMLAAKRFDYFPRALVEIEAELPMINTYKLMIEPNLTLEYPNPMYFFVQKNNTELAERLERGWEIILKNGAFDQLFYDQARVQNALKRLEPEPRSIIHLRTPDLPEKTPLHDQRYWYRPATSNQLPL